MHRRLTAIVTVIAAVIVFALAGYVLTENDPVPDAGTTPTTADQRLPSGAVSVTPTSSRNSRSGNVVAFLGDDYTVGIGASTKSKGFTALLSAQLNITGKVFGSDQAGYAKASSGGKTYADYVDAVVATHPDVVVVTGGRNDQVDLPASVASAARHLFAQLHTKLPNAELVAVRPFWGDSPAPKTITDVASEVKSAVTHAGGIYLDVPDPLEGHPGWMADAADPNDAGYAAIAAAIEPKLATLLPG